MLKVKIAFFISFLSSTSGLIVVCVPFAKPSSGLKYRELIVLILSLLNILITSFKMAASPILDALIIFGI